MGDGDSILGAVASSAAELGKDIIKTTVSAPSGIIKGGVKQVTGIDSEETEMKREEDKLRRFQRIKRIEAEITQIAHKNSQRSGPQINTPSDSSSENEEETLYSASKLGTNIVAERAQRNRESDKANKG